MKKNFYLIKCNCGTEQFCSGAYIKEAWKANKESCWKCEEFAFGDDPTSLKPNEVMVRELCSKCGLSCCCDEYKTVFKICKIRFVEGRALSSINI